MPDDLKFVFVATGRDSKNPRLFTGMGPAHVAVAILRLDKSKSASNSLITPPARVRFVHFNFEKDDIFVKDHLFGAKTPREDGKWKRLAEVTDNLSAFITQEGAQVSITDIYQAVRQAPAGSVIDISLYSHGFVEGPVLGNTSDFATPQEWAPGLPKRRPDDRDGRVRTDFFPNMGEDPAGRGQDALTKFKAGLATGAVFRIFGCNVQDVVFVDENGDVLPFGGEKLLLRSITWQVLREAFKLPISRNTAIGRQLRRTSRTNKVMPAAVSLDMQAEFIIEASLTDDHLSHDYGPGNLPLTANKLREIHYAADAEFFQGVTNPDPITRSYVEVVKFCARQVMKTYVFQASKALPHITCFGAVPGVAGSFDQEGKHRLMFVDAKVYGFILKFFEVYLDIDRFEVGAPVQRNYGIFNAATVAKIEDHLVNG